jgi:hypothetical protein
LKTAVAIVFAAGLLAAAAVNAKTAPADAPAGTTAQCKDGSWFSGAEKKGACSGHKGIKDWYGAADDKKATAAPAKAETPKADAPKTAAAPAPAKEASTKTQSARKTPTKAEDIVAKPGGGPGLVWVNESSKVYHCQGDKWYGKTKQGEYMSEADAKAKGIKADHGKACKA